MSKQETDKTKPEQTKQINLEDLPVDEAQLDEVKGSAGTGTGRIYTITITATDAF